MINASTDKFTSFYGFVDNRLFYNNYIDDRTILHTLLYNDDIFHKDCRSKKLHKPFFQFGTILKEYNNLPSINLNFNNSFYVDVNSSTEISIPCDLLPKHFDICYSPSY